MSKKITSKFEEEVKRLESLGCSFDWGQERPRPFTDRVKCNVVTYRGHEFGVLAVLGHGYDLYHELPARLTKQKKKKFTSLKFLSIKGGSSDSAVLEELKHL